VRLYSGHAPATICEGIMIRIAAIWTICTGVVVMAVSCGPPVDKHDLRTLAALWSASGLLATIATVLTG